MRSTRLLLYRYLSSINYCSEFLECVHDVRVVDNGFYDTPGDTTMYLLRDNVLKLEKFAIHP